MPNAFGNYSKAEYDAALGEVETRARGLDDQVQALQEAMGKKESGDRIATMARDSLTRAKKDGEVDRLAEATLADEVVGPLIAEKVTEIVELLKHERTAGAQAQVTDPEWVNEVRAKKDQMLQADGTYKKIDDDAQTEKHKRILDELMVERKTAAVEAVATAELSPEAVKQLELDAERELETYRTGLLDGLAQKVQAAMIESGQARIDQEVATTYDEGLGEAVATWVKGGSGRAYRNMRQKESSCRLNADSEEQGKALIDKEVSDEQAIFDTYLARFKRDGVDLSSLPEDMTVTLVMGQIVEVKNPKCGQYGASQNEPKTILKFDGEKRIMKLLSKTGGLFYVQQDSLAKATSPYTRNDSLAQKVVSFGRRSEDRSNGRLTTIEPKISYSETPFFDDDTTDPDIIIDGGLPIANIFIDGVPAIKRFAKL